MDDTDAADDALTERARVDLPATRAEIQSTRDTMETQVGTVGAGTAACQTGARHVSAQKGKSLPKQGKQAPAPRQ